MYLPSGACVLASCETLDMHAYGTDLEGDVSRGQDEQDPAHTIAVW